LRLAGRQVRRPQVTIATPDHNVPTTDRDKPIAQEFLDDGRHGRDLGMEAMGARVDQEVAEAERSAHTARLGLGLEDRKGAVRPMGEKARGQACDAAAQDGQAGAAAATHF